MTPVERAGMQALSDEARQLAAAAQTNETLWLYLAVARLAEAPACRVPSEAGGAP